MTTVQQKKNPRWCILFGPLSLVNASKASASRTKQVGFANVNSDYSEYLLYVEFEYEFKTYYKKVNSKKLKHYNSTINVNDFDAAEHSVYAGIVKTEWNQHRIPFWPLFKYKKEKTIVPRVHISWCAPRRGDISNDRRTVKKHDQILIDYTWIKKKVFYKSADYKPEKQFYKDDKDEEKEEEEEEDNDYNENEDDNDGKHNNNIKIIILL